MKCKIEYKTVGMNNVCYLDREINKLLNDGWELYGSPYSTSDYKYQALIKKENIENEGEK